MILVSSCDLQERMAKKEQKEATGSVFSLLTSNQRATLLHTIPVDSRTIGVVFCSVSD
jgi:hypothetical protein